MKWFKRKDGSVFGKENPSEDQMKEYKKAGHKECDESGGAIKKAKKAKKQCRLTSSNVRNAKTSLTYFRGLILRNGTSVQSVTVLALDG